MINVGIVGGRGLSCMKGLRSTEGVHVEALCELDEKLLDYQADAYGIPKRFRIYEDMLAADIDAVIVATPMQLHFQQSMQALEAGKHVLSEVTAGVTLDELWWLIECVEKYKKVYMMAENYCYIPQVQLIGNMVKEGMFGDVYFAEGEYLHEGKKLAKYADGRTSWRSFWQLGTRGVFYPTHSLGPLMQWFGNDHIQSVSCFGSGRHVDAEFMQEDTTLAMIRLESGKLIKLRIDCMSPRPNNLTYYTLQGTKGCYEAPRGLGDDHKVWFTDMDADTESARWQPLSKFNAYLPRRYKEATQEQKDTGHWGGDFFIVEDFIHAVKTGEKPAVDVYQACEWSAVAMLSALSADQGGKAVQMPKFWENLPIGERIVKL